jgi:hypothetical protein
MTQGYLVLRATARVRAGYAARSPAGSSGALPDTHALSVRQESRRKRRRCASSQRYLNPGAAARGKGKASQAILGVVSGPMGVSVSGVVRIAAPGPPAAARGNEFDARQRRQANERRNLEPAIERALPLCPVRCRVRRRLAALRPCGLAALRPCGRSRWPSRPTQAGPKSCRRRTAAPTTYRGGAWLIGEKRRHDTRAPTHVPAYTGARHPGNSTASPGSSS